MNRTIISFFILFIILITAQIMICNHILLFHVASPIIFIYFILRLPMSISPNLLYTLSFLLGFCVDVFSDTPGVNSLSCTLLAILRKPVFRAYNSHDEEAMHRSPDLASLGIAVFSKYLFSMTLIYCVISFSLEYLSLFNLQEAMIRAIASTLLSFVVLLGIDSLGAVKK